MENRILEKDLRLPALYLIHSNNGKISTTELSDALREILKPSGGDLEILKDRGDDNFSQIVRNLTATQRTFVKNGFIKRDAPKNSPLFITEIGENYLQKHSGALRYLLTNDFEFDDLAESFRKIEENQDKRKVEVFDENITINEGAKGTKNVNVYERSSLLRTTAIDHFTKDGVISCSCCSFNFRDFYGDVGSGFIEIHHIKPIFKFEDEDLKIKIREALDNLMPVCSNCHRMIHRNWKKPLEIQLLVNNIHENGIFNGRKIEY